MTTDADLLAYASTLAREAVQTITLRTIRNRAPNHLGRALTVEEGMAIAETLANASISIGEERMTPHRDEATA